MLKGKADGKDETARMYVKLPCIKVDGDTAVPSIHEVIEEIPLTLFVNGRHLVTAMMSPVMLDEYATGYLFTEQIIKSPDEIESVKIEKNRISVITKNLFKVLGPKKTILSGCGGSTSYIDVEKMPKIRSGYTVTVSEIRDAIKNGLNTELHKLTGGIHVVALADHETVLVVSEDIGRHNALDRVIGWGLKKGTDFSRTYVIVSGRISSEMVRKCLTANIPIIVSRGATTTLAVEIADKTGLCVAGFVRAAKMVVYTHPHRFGILPG